MARGHKRYFVTYVDDHKICGDYVHMAGNASTIKSAKAIVANIRREYANDNPHQFMIFDTFGEADESTGCVPCIYTEE